jgi:hypothetical protein
MKLLIQIVLFHILTPSLNLYCQDTAQTSRRTPKLFIGVKFIGEKSGNYMTPTTRLVFNGGVQILKKINSNFFSFETGLYSITKAIVLRDDSYSKTRTFDIKFRNLSIPFNCRFDNKIIYLSIGPNFDYLIKQDFSNWILITRADIRKFWIGANLNFGLKLKIDKLKFIFIEGRYSKGLLTLSKSSFRFEPNFTNYGIAVGLSVVLDRRQK